MVKAVADPLEDAVAAELAAKFSMLTPEEIAAARKKAHDKFEATAKTKAINDIIDMELHRLAVKTGDSYRDEEIMIHIDQPPFADRLIVDGRTFFNNHIYKLPRHQVESMREMMARQWDHEADIKGESLTQKMGQYRVKNFGSIEGSKTISAKDFAA